MAGHSRAFNRLPGRCCGVTPEDPGPNGTKPKKPPASTMSNGCAGGLKSERLTALGGYAVLEKAKRHALRVG